MNIEKETKFKINDWVVPTGFRFKGIQQIKELKIDKELDRICYLIGDAWCFENDFKSWVPNINDKIIRTLSVYLNNDYVPTKYTVISTVKGIEFDTIFLDDHSSVKINEIQPCLIKL